MQARTIFDHVVEAFETVFEPGKWTKVDHLPDEHKATLAANPTFETKGDAPAPEAPKAA